MKNLFLTIAFSFLLSLVWSQKNIQTGAFHIDNPFNNLSFIENKGQFNDLFKSKNNVLFYTNTMQMDIAFLKDEIIYRIEKNELKESDYKEKKEEEREKENKKKEVYFLKLNFDGMNENVELINDQLNTHYYTYIDNSNHNKLHPATIKANAYKKLIYKNIYSNIDLEYTISEKGGVKYSFILHPGADASQIKMRYSDSKVKFDKEKNLELYFGETKIIDHKPITFYEDNSPVESAFSVNKNIVSFSLANYDKNKKVIIDPWTINPAFAGTNSGYDISRDASGNVYVSGGNIPYYLKKYNSTGTLLWTFTYPNSQQWYGDHCLDNAGNCFLSYGPWVGISTTKVDPNGNVIYNNVTPATIYNTGETYKLLFNFSTGKLYGVGFYCQNYSTTIRQSIFEFDPTSGNIIGQFDPLTGAEIRSGLLDNNGDLILYTIPMAGQPFTNNKLIKVNSNINTVAFQSSTGSTMSESDQTYVPNWYSGFNGVAVDCENGYYSFDGLLLQKHSTTTGSTILGPINVPNGVTYSNSGIWVDRCKNTYVGTQTGVKVFDPSFNLISTIATSGPVFDIIEGAAGEVLICGQGFVSSVTAVACAASSQINISVNDTICSGSSYTLPNGNVVTTSGTYSSTVNSRCADTVFSINLYVKPAAMYILDTTICFGGTIAIPGGGSTSTSGTYSDTLVGSNGCDSIVVLNLSVFPQVVITINASICNGDSYTLPNGGVVSSAGNYLDTLTNSKGCDSIIAVNLTVNSYVSQTINQAICSGNSYTLPSGTVVSVAGTYVDTINGTIGCDTIFTVNLTTNSNVLQTINPVICSGNSYTLPGGAIVSVAGTYIDTINGTIGCDTIFTVNLTISPIITQNISATICQGDTYLLPGGSTVTNAGIYTDTIPSTAGCDSIFSITLSVNPLVSFSISASICQGATYSLPGGGSAVVSGIYNDTLPSLSGCDSVITTNLTVMPVVITSLSGVIQCAGQTYTLPDGTVVNAAGIYNDTLTSSKGCDSIVSVTVTINPSPIASFIANPTSGTAPLPVNFTNTSQNANSFNWNFGDGNSSNQFNPSNTYDSAGTYEVILIVTNGFGCYDTTKATIIVFAGYSVFVPNVFSPNNDGSNDFFFINVEGVKSMYCEIYDRWGLKMIEWNNPNYKWDGYTTAGIPVVDGTYYYIMKLTEHSGKDHMLTGFITIVR